MARLTAEEIAEWTKKSCERQGIEVKIRDRRVVEQVRVLLTGRAGRRAAAR